MPNQPELVAKVEAHLRDTGIAASRFGLEAVGDPNFVRNLRAGREPRSRVVSRVLAFMEHNTTAQSEHVA